MTRETAELIPKVAEQKRTTSKRAPLFQHLLLDRCGRWKATTATVLFPLKRWRQGEPTATLGLHCSPVWGHGSPRGLGCGQAVLQDPPTPRPQQVLVSWPRAPWNHQHFRCQHDPCRERMRRTLLRWKKLFLLHFNPLITLPSLGTVSNISVSRGFPGGPMVKICLPMQGTRVRSLVGELRSPMLGVTKPMQHCNYWAHEL